MDVAGGVPPNQFSVGSHDNATSLEGIDPIYKRLLDEPVAAAFAVLGKDGRPNLTPMGIILDAAANPRGLIVSNGGILTIGKP